ncbi:hypothetical protein HDU89_008488 [Geranomyces variabilis]|nr:hypothetical protein HDU89_008488 [Geranomyces variabilis]
MPPSHKKTFSPRKRQSANAAAASTTTAATTATSSSSTTTRCKRKSSNPCKAASRRDTDKVPGVVLRIGFDGTVDVVRACGNVRLTPSLEKKARASSAASSQRKDKTRAPARRSQS